MKKSLLVTALLALAVIAAPFAQTEAGFNLGNAIKKLPGTSTSKTSANAPSVSKASKMITGRIVMPDGTPWKNGQVLCGIGLRYKVQDTSWIISPTELQVGVGIVDKEGNFSLQVETPKPVDVIVFSMEGSEPVIIRNVMHPHNLGNVTVSPGKIKSVFSGYVAP